MKPTGSSTEKSTTGVKKIISEKMRESMEKSGEIQIKDKKQITPFEQSQATEKDLDKGGELLFGAITSNIPGFDKIQLPKYDVNFLGSRLSAVNLVIRYLVDILLIIPWFIIYNLYEGSKQIIGFLRNKEFKKAVIYFFLYSLDSLLPMSYIFLFFIMVSISNEIMFNWVGSCFILFCSFLLLVVYYSLVSEPFEGWKDFFNFNHLDTLGLAMCRRIYEERNQPKSPQKQELPSFRPRSSSIQKKLAAKTKNHSEFSKSLKAIFEALTIDDTFFYYSYFADDLDQENSADPLISEYLAKEMIFVHHKGEHLLFRMNENSLGIEEKQHEIGISTVLVFLLLIFFKIVVPYIYMFEELNEQEINSFAVFSITLFYIFIMTVLFPLISHEDIKRRTYILESLNRLVTFHRDNVGEDEDNSPGRTINHDTIIQMKIPAGETISELQLKMDVTCMISLETWDKCRRAAVLMDQKRSEKYEIIYIFLGIYAFFILLVLLQSLFQVYVFFSSSSPLNSPLIVVIFTIDFTIMLILLFQRIYHGTTFNETFLKHQDSLDRLIYIFQDLSEILDLYRNNPRPINNVIYKAIFERILAKYEKVKGQFEDQDPKEGTKFLKNYLRRLIETANRIKNQLAFDENHFKHRFLGILTSDFQTILAQTLIILIPIIPTLWSTIDSY